MLEEFEISKLFQFSVLAAIFFFSILPALSQSESTVDCLELEEYLSSSLEMKEDIVFVFDTTGSMGGEIQEMKEICRDFAEGLVSKGVDYRLGLTSFKDFPISCSSDRNTPCGKSSDTPYKVHNDGKLTDSSTSFKSWLNGLRASGGGDDPEAILAAIAHTASDMQWRGGEVEKMIILITDAPPHPDGDCCNAEGNTLHSISAKLAESGIKVYIIGPEIDSLEILASDTGGKLYKIRSGLTLRPILEEIISEIVCTFSVVPEINCMDNHLEIDVLLLGKDEMEIPYSEDLTESWLFLKYDNGMTKRFDLEYNRTRESYHILIDDVSGIVELTIHGKVCQWKSVIQVRADCRESNQAPTLSSLTSDPTSSQVSGTAVTWTGGASDPEGDTIYYKFRLKGPSTSDKWADQTKWTENSNWTWTTTDSDIGINQIEVRIRDSKYAPESSFDDSKITIFSIMSGNQPPFINDLSPDKESPLIAGSSVTWTASAQDPESDTVYYKFRLKGPSTSDKWEDKSDWAEDNSWTWTTTTSDIGISQIEVRIRDANHADSSSFDDSKITIFGVASGNLPPEINDLNSDKKSPLGAGSSVTWTASASDPEGDTLYYKFRLKGPSTNDKWEDKTGWSRDSKWTWTTKDSDIGINQVEVRIRDANHANENGFDDSKITIFGIVSENQLPVINDLSYGEQSLLTAGSAVTWTASASDPEGDTLYYKFRLKGPSTNDKWEDKTEWSRSNSWTWTTTDSDIGTNQIEVRIRDTKHAEENGFDDSKITIFSVVSGNQLPKINDLSYGPQSSLTPGSSVTWTASAQDPEGDALYYKFRLKGPSTNDKWEDKSVWSMSNSWTWTTSDSNIGINQIEVRIRDANHADENGFDDSKITIFGVMSGNLAPMINDLSPDRQSPLATGSSVTWTGGASDPEGDTLYYKFRLKGPSTNDKWEDKSVWSMSNSWTWTTTDSDIGINQVEVRIRDANHADSGSFDDSKIVIFGVASVDE